MKILYGKELNNEEHLKVAEIASSCDISFDTARLLLYRNIDTPEKAKAFLSAGKNGFHNPLALSGMKEAVERVTLAKERGEKVLVFGDYDADGICASTVLKNCLHDFGIIPEVFVPEREDNYGINVNIVKNLAEKNPINLLITVDCGISDKDKIEELKKIGIDVIVTDHHEPPEDLPDCILINPKIAGQTYPFDGLCGAGVAYKLGYALIGEMADKYLDFVALATVADSMDLIGENRDIVTEGLKLFNDAKTLRKPFKYLLGDNSRQVTAQTFMYTLAPRVNAGGRMGDAKCALNLFTETDENKIFDLAAKLNEYNLARQVECDNIYKEAKAKIVAEGLDKKQIILVGDEKWRVGFVGIVASRLVEDYSRPVIVFAGHDGYLKGSARSVDGVNIFDALTAIKDDLVAFGGHSQAAGVTVEKHNFSLVLEKLDKIISAIPNEGIGEKSLYADMLLTEPISLRFAREIDLLEPFGVGNRRPLFATTVNEITSLPLKTGSAHYSYKTKAVEMLDFNGERNVTPLSLPIAKTVLFELNLSSYKNRESLKGYVRHVVLDLSNTNPIKPYIFKNELKNILGEKSNQDSEFYRANNLTATLNEFADFVSTDRTDFIGVFNRLLNVVDTPFSDSATFAIKHFDESEVYQAIFVLEVFFELGIFASEKGYFTYKEKIKNALTNSNIYSKINAIKVSYA